MIWNNSIAEVLRDVLGLLSLKYQIDIGGRKAQECQTRCAAASPRMKEACAFHHRKDLGILGTCDSGCARGTIHRGRGPSPSANTNA